MHHQALYLTASLLRYVEAHTFLRGGILERMEKPAVSTPGPVPFFWRDKLSDLISWESSLPKYSISIYPKIQEEVLL